MKIPLLLFVLAGFLASIESKHSNYIESIISASYNKLTSQNNNNNWPGRNVHIQSRTDRNPFYSGNIRCEHDHFSQKSLEHLKHSLEIEYNQLQQEQQQANNNNGNNNLQSQSSNLGNFQGIFGADPSSIGPIRINPIFDYVTGTNDVYACHL